MTAFRIALRYIIKCPQQSHPSLFQLRSFWATVLLPIGLAILVTFFIAQSLHYPDVLLTKEGFDNAYDYFKIPLWIAALSLPLAGFYASHHRSVQTAAQIARSDNQIAATESKNNFENYIKHTEQFKNDLERISEKHGFEVIDDVDLYRMIFSLNSYDRFFPWSDKMEYIDFVGESDDIPVRYDNYFSYVRFYIDKVIDSIDYEYIDGDAFNMFFIALTLLKVNKMKGVNIRNKEEMENYFVLDNKVYVSEFRYCVSDFGNFLISLESICLSKKNMDEMKNIDSFNRSSLFVYAYGSSNLKVKTVYRTNGNGEVKETRGTLKRIAARGRIAKAK